MNEREKKFLGAFLGVAALSVLLVAGVLYADFRRSTFESLLSLRKEVAGMRRIAAELPAYRDELSRMEADPSFRPAKAASRDLYALARKLSREIAASGLKTMHSGLTGAGDEAVLDIGVTGPLQAVLGMLRTMSEEPGYGIISSRISVDEKDGLAAAEVRLGHESE